MADHMIPEGEPSYIRAHDRSMSPDLSLSLDIEPHFLLGLLTSEGRKKRSLLANKRWTDGTLISSLLPLGVV